MRNGVTRAKSADEEPHVIMTDWCVIRNDLTDDLYFLGRTPEGKPRITTEIQEFEPLLMSGRTRSGRFYRLEGDPTDNGGFIAFTVARILGLQMLGAVTVLDVDNIPIAMPARGMA